MKIVSACLVGVNCRYDGKGKANNEVIDLVNKGLAIPICPEQLGGLSTPRKPSEQVGNKVITNDLEDVTDKFKKGAEEALEIALLCGCRSAILKSNSPSCGVGKVYDGTFTGKLIIGDGVFTKLLKSHGISVRSEK